MLRLGILGLGAVTAMVVLDCGGRTPLQDDDLFGAPGSITTTGASGASVGSGPGGTLIIGGAGGGVVTTTGAGGSSIDPGFGGTRSGTGGSVIVGTGGATGFGGTAAGSTGSGGSVGTAGSSGGTGGFIGMGGAGGGPNLVRRLVNELPGTRPNNDCLGCAGMCQGSAQCAANPTCVDGLACAASNCGMQNGNPGLGCLAKCLGGDPQAIAQAVAALQCIYGTCARSCSVGRMR